MLYKKSFVLLFIFTTPVYADAILTDTCDNLFSLLNRPSVAETPCAVKPGDMLVEFGYQYASLYPEDGTSYNLPETQLRFGLPYSYEIAIFLPNYVYEKTSHQNALTGSNATAITLKHQFPIHNKWTYAGEGIFILPTGNTNFGSNALGATLNGIVNYDLTSSISATVMLGVSTLTEPSAHGGQRYNTFNPDIVVSWQSSANIQWYGEVYGQTKTAPNQSDGYNTDFGVQYLLTKNIEVDAEYGLRLSGELGGFSHYLGVGSGLRF